MAVALLCTALLAGSGLAWYLYTKAGTQQQEPTASDVTGAPPARTQPVLPQAGPTLTAPAAGSGEPVASPAPPALSPPEPLDTPADEEQVVIDQCQRVASRLQDFLLHLEQRDYIQDYQLDQPPPIYFTALAEKLLTNPPVVTRERDDLYTILKNTAHFFRIIGKDNILILKAILDRERDRIEDIAADLYQWIVLPGCSTKEFPFAAPLDQVYEYAGFFLNTLGGRSYLFRRDSRSRLLVNFYSVLIIDRANAEKINSHGIDIKEILPRLIEEIEGSNQLIYKEHYLERLDAIQERYE